MVKKCVPDLRECVIEEASSTYGERTCDKATGWSTELRDLGPAGLIFSVHYDGHPCYTARGIRGGIQLIHGGDTDAVAARTGVWCDTTMPAPPDDPDFTLDPTRSECDLGTSTAYQSRRHAT
jgi:hypothetical protein